MAVEPEQRILHTGLHLVSQPAEVVNLHDRRREGLQGLSVVSKYEGKWIQSGDGLFDAQAEVGPRPLRDVLVRELSTRGGNLLVVEAASGAGGDAIEVVRAAQVSERVDSIRYMAIDSSATAASLAQRNIQESGVRLDQRTRIVLVNDMAAPALRRVEPGTANFIYTVSLAHALDDRGFDELIDESRNALTKDGRFLIGLKTVEDSLLGRPDTIVTGHGPRGIRAIPVHDRIERHFLNGPSELDELMWERGLERAAAPVSWRAKGYDFPHDEQLKTLEADFLGGIYKKR